METQNLLQEIKKPWQKGISLETIESFRKVFDNTYNKFARSPFTQWNGPKIADSISKNRLHRIGNAVVDMHIAKTSTDITMYFDVKIGRKSKGDRVVNAIAATKNDIEVVVSELKQIISKSDSPNTWFFIWEEDSVQKEIVKKLGLTKIGVKITSFSEIYGVYFSPGQNYQIKHPAPEPAELACMVQLKTFPNFSELCNKMGDRIRSLEEDFANHYSKYNKSKAWGALSLRGYSSDPSMIEKPSCMSEAWQKEHKDDNFVIQDTELFSKFPEVKKILKSFPTNKFDRIRLMRLQPGGGELSRHVDHVESDSGITDGRIMRFHIPIITNPKVIFTMWNTEGVKVEQNMKQGETWMFDFRKPHMAVNGGDDIRIHLVIDVVMDKQMRSLIEQNI